MNFGILCFVLLFCLPMFTVMAMLPDASLAYVGEVAGAAVLCGVLAFIAPRLLARIRRRRELLPTADLLAGLDWPASLSRKELELFCAAWLRSRGWQATLTISAVEGADGVYVTGQRDGVTLAILCDVRGEELNPATIRNFTQTATGLGATRLAVVTLLRGKLPHPAEAAARHQGVILLRVAELPQLDVTAPAEREAVA